ncbi:uncharacterized protein BDZ99DRAFT_562038 [Mytilinidion resinicola]|uniref:GST C-terminal domain-containing protein n=1 Tax=Mytilinidion resinicola TaxID=574789 RepID=A0A6A6YQQ1_9PEZI|nr:uncharacterized protein BDZ99DRAFT_562038 [Mytilinidion resinicola]KAF2811110.1 hypothetical protein BDZ99DRAFT_562038 [Mytilinidion resinicola]
MRSPPALPFYIRSVFSGFCNAMANMHLQKLDSGLVLMEDALTDERPWFAGAKMGLSDINMVWPMDVPSQRGYFDAKKFPKVTYFTGKWATRVCRPPYQKFARRDA